MEDEGRRSFIKRVLQGGTTLGLAGIAGCTRSYDSTERGGGPEKVNYREVAKNPEPYLHGDSGTDLRIKGELEITGSNETTVHIKANENGEHIQSHREANVVVHQVKDYNCDNTPGNLDFIDEYGLSDELWDAGASEGCVDINIPAAVIEVYEFEHGLISGSYESEGYALYVG